MPHPLWATCSNVSPWQKNCFHIASCSFPGSNLWLLPLVVPLCCMSTADSRPASCPPGPSNPFPESRCLASRCQPVLVCGGGVPSHTRESVCVFELHEAPARPFSQPFQVKSRAVIFPSLWSTVVEILNFVMNSFR